MRQHRPVALLRLHPRRLLLPGLPPAGHRRPARSAPGWTAWPPQSREDHDHPQVRDRLLAAAHPRRLPPRDVRRRDPALPPGLPGVGLRADARGLPAAQAAVPLREPLLAARPAAVEGAGPRGRPRRRRRRHGAQPAPRRPGVEPAPQLRDPLAPRRHGRAARGPRAGHLRRRGPLDPHPRHWWVFPVDPRTGVLPGEVRAVFEAVRDDPSVKRSCCRAHAAGQGRWRASSRRPRRERAGADVRPARRHHRGHRSARAATSTTPCRAASPPLPQARLAPPGWSRRGWC